jgi:hypothetical protein
MESYWWVEPHMLYRTRSGVVYDHRGLYASFYHFIKDLPLNNGAYRDAEPVVSSTRLRAIGQKDVTNRRAHLWIQNIDSTWYNAINGVAVSPVSGTVRISGFRAGETYRASWWDTRQTDPARQIRSIQSIRADTNGMLTLTISGLTTDTAVQIAPEGGASLGEFEVYVPLVTAAP